MDPRPESRSGLYRWLNQRYNLDAALEFARHKKVPLHRESVWYYFGGVTLFLFLIQVLTGVLLLLYYRPGADTSHESLRFIVSQVEFGWLFRSVHSWSANLMILAAFIHMFSNFFTQAYRQPRELSWITGMLLFFLALGFGFSGYLLPWNELAFFATKVGTDIAGAVPLVGPPLLIFLRGGEDVTAVTLSRFFGWHVALLPMIFTLLLGLHLLFVQIQGMSVPAALPRAEAEKRSMPFFPSFALRDVILWLVVLNIVAVLSVFFPWELGPKADAFAPAPAGIKPEWYFLFMFETLKLIPGHVLGLEGEILGVLFFGVAGLLWTLVPFLDRHGRQDRPNPWLRVAGVLAIAYIVVMTLVGFLS
ncbi:MAG: cytochrome bc complex cytochrome b subunit [Candidatus Zixiibacteriota bacterium]|nr:MAG: cytochrome bc complex cytochrome b subunit [candidate division Zixibacteria bacterium]